MTRIEVQGGGIIDTGNSARKLGTRRRTMATPGSVGHQLNSAMMFTISDSNLNDFSDAAVFVHPDGAHRLDLVARRRHSRPAAAWTASRCTCTCTTTRSRTRPWACTSTPTNVADTPGESALSGDAPQQHVLQRPVRRSRPLAPQFNGTNSESHVSLLAMNNIFDGSIAGRRQPLGPGGRQVEVQYNLFYNNATNLDRQQPSDGDADWAGNLGARSMRTRSSSTRRQGNFELEPNSPAIDAARSEIGPLAAATRSTHGHDHSQRRSGRAGSDRPNHAAVPGKYPVAIDFLRRLHDHR